MASAAASAPNARQRMRSMAGSAPQHALLPFGMQTERRSPPECMRNLQTVPRHSPSLFPGFHLRPQHVCPSACCSADNPLLPFDSPSSALCYLAPPAAAEHTRPLLPAPTQQRTRVPPVVEHQRSLSIILDGHHRGAARAHDQGSHQAVHAVCAVVTVPLHSRDISKQQQIIRVRQICSWGRVCEYTN